MRLGFKHFDIGKRKFCVRVYQTYDYYFSNITINIFPVFTLHRSYSSKSITLSWLLWQIELEDETNINMCGGKA